MTECGQASAHWPHWIQLSVSQIGTSSEMLRFSQAAVPSGNVPSTGIALTGNSSPRPAMIAAVTRCTNSGAEGDTVALFAVGFLDHVLDALHGFVARQDARNREKAGLQDGIDLGAEPGVPGD